MSTIYILYGFYKKLLNGDSGEMLGVEGNNHSRNVSLIDNPITYANTSVPVEGDAISVVTADNINSDDKDEEVPIAELVQTRSSVNGADNV